MFLTLDLSLLGSTIGGNRPYYATFVQLCWTVRIYKMKNERFEASLTCLLRDFVKKTLTAIKPPLEADRFSPHDAVKPCAQVSTDS
jgi:hypothetical protein